MTVFVELTTDAFDDVFARRVNGLRGGENSGRSARAGSSSVRRPLRGIEIKDDTYAIFKVIRADGQEIPMIDSSGPDGLSSGGYANFMLQSVKESRVEKSQIVQTFGDNYVFFFGEDPRFIECQAIILNTHDFNWRAEWWANYNYYMRGSKLAELGARLYLFYDDIIVEGYMMDSHAVGQSMAPYQIQLQFRMFVTNYQNISLVGSPFFPIRSSVVLPDDIELSDPAAGNRLTTYYRGEALNQAELENFDRQFQEADAGGATAKDTDPDVVTLGPFEASAQASDGQAGLTVGIPPGNSPASSANPLASKSRISKILRSAPASFAVSQGIWDFLFTTATIDEVVELQRLIVRAGNPIRGRITDNLDEYTGGDPRGNFGFAAGELRPPSTLRGTIQSRFESNNLFNDTIQFLSCYGADVNSHTAMISLGLGPNFTPEISDGGTFNPTGDPTSLEDFFGNVADSANNGYQGVTDSFDNFAQDPLGSVFGRSDSSGSTISNRSKYTEGAGDPLYGYPSDFAEGKPGFGIPGFGDLGGNGFGSALGETGDPGFKDPSKFTYAGVSDNRGAFDRFLAPREDPTALTETLGGAIGLGGANNDIGGDSSAFAIVSVPGLLDPSGDARSVAEAIAAKQAKQRFGFSQDNPFGVNCPSPESDGLSFSLP